MVVSEMNITILFALSLSLVALLLTYFVGSYSNMIEISDRYKLEVASATPEV